MKLFHLLFISSFICFSLSAQQHCFTTEMYKKAVQEHPEVLQVQQQLEQFTEQYTAQQATHRDAATVYTIPVVFHIIHNYGPENISDEQIKDEIRILNLDFRKKNSDTMAI